MEEEIIRKLKEQLSKEIKEESQVLYILAEARKFIEEFDPGAKHNYPNLYFVCNWVLHIKMERTPAKSILEKLDDIFAKIHESRSRYYGPQLKSQAVLNKHISFFLLEDFRKEFAKFLTEYRLPLQITKLDNWVNFRPLLLEILADCPLVKENGIVRKFSFIKGGSISFAVSLEDGAKYKWTAEDVKGNFASGTQLQIWKMDVVLADGSA